MKFDKIIMNPPYNLGNKITEAVLSSLNDNGDCVCLQPLSQYKRKELYRHVDTFELADPKLFQDAVITENLCICTLNRADDNTSNYLLLLLKAADSNLTEAYKYSIGKHTMQITGGKWKSPEDFDQNLDFLDSWRITSTSHGAIPSFRKCGTYYKWNTFTYSKGDKWTNGYVCIRFPTKTAKDNFCKYAYNYNTLDERKFHLCGRMLGGVNTANMTNTYYFANNRNQHFSFNAEEQFLPVYQYADEHNKKITHIDSFAEKFLEIKYSTIAPVLKYSFINFESIFPLFSVK